ncbi:MAG: hypothetical protein IPM51_04625 [Sphingobacteriaceae bacterium]|nr:hypothetical protein [Sphingobacteriaceae bacterium]
MCSVFSIIYFANNKKGKFIWLSGFLASLLLLLLIIFLLVQKITHKARNFVSDLEHSFEMNIDTTFANKSYKRADTAQSKQIQYLKMIEKPEHKNAIPSQFYTYLGFQDYYRLPLVYPFAIHCTDSLDNGYLYNESEVVKFDQSDNGEVHTGIINIVEFNFDQNIFIAKIKYDTEKNKHRYIIYFLNSGEKEEFDTAAEFTKRAQQLKFGKSLQLLSCQKYFKLL